MKIRYALTLSSVLFVSGCDDTAPTGQDVAIDDTQPAPDTRVADTAAPPDTSGGIDTAAEDSAGETVQPPPAFPGMPEAGAQPLPRGRLVVESTRYTDFFDTQRERGVFAASLIQSRSAGPCEVEHLAGHCALETCDRSPARVDGGALSLEVNGTEVTSLTFDTTPQLYFTQDEPTAWFGAGDTVSVSGPGSAGAPAFSISAEGPASVTLTSPSLPAPPGILDINTANSLALSWEPLAGETLVVSLEWKGSNEAQTLSCFFDAGAGSGEIPVEALSLMPLDEHELVAYTQGVASSVVEGWTITLATRVTALRSAGQRWVARAQLQ